MGAARKPILTFITSLLLFSLQCVGQAVVNKGSNIGLTPQEFVETYLVGTGITISNALYNGSSEPLNSPDRVPAKYRDQIGSFTASGGALSELGIGGGVILSSGYSNKAVAGSNPDDDMWGNSQPAESDPDLVILAGGSTINDKSVLEFDFIPQTDIITFRYVFGSIEFDGFCSSINDAFGLFLSGPGIAGGLGFANNAVNIALLPNSTSYVNIFNICEADQGNLGQGVYSWWNSKKDYYSYNRLTYVFTATYSVQCNQTYHMKFAIGDASDGVLDSGVFLEQNSFTSNNISGSTSFSNPLTGQLLVEGCNGVTLTYSIPQTQLTNLTVNLAVQPTGTATVADITPNPFPAQAIIPAGQLTSTPILINAVADGLPEGSESLVIKGSTTNSCGLSNEVTTNLTIKDYGIMTVALDNQLICNGSSVTLSPIVSGGQPVVASNDYIYLWSTGATTPTLNVSPPAGHHTYGLTVTDACNQVVSKEISVDVGTTPGPAGPISGDNTICTPISGAGYAIASIPGADSYIWTIPSGGSITSGANTNSITVSFNTATLPGIMEVRGHSDICGDGPSAFLAMTINPAAPAAGAVSGPAVVCQGPDVINYSIEPLNFVYSYEWSIPPGVTIVSGEGTNQISCVFGTSATSGLFTVKGLNLECGPGPPSSLAVTVNPIPAASGPVTGSSGSEICVPETAVLFQVTPIQHATSYNWVYTGSNTVINNHGSQAGLDFAANATSGQLIVTGINSCGSGLPSPPLTLTIKPKPVVMLPASIQTINTTKNGRPIQLRGGTPYGAGGIYSGTGVTEVTPGIFVFDPSGSDVVAGGTANGNPYTITYNYTNIYNCNAQSSLVIRVFASNANNACPGQVKDVRDNREYQTFLSGNGVTAKCWLAENLDYGAFINHSVPQADNFIPEKYCPNDQPSSCLQTGGFYQWNEMMQHTDNPLFQDICPPGWHVPTIAEWQTLISFSLGNGLGGNVLKDLNDMNGFQGLLTGFLYQNKLWSYSAGALTGAMYWTSESVSTHSAWSRGLNSLNPSISLYPAAKSGAFSVRCLRN